MELNQITSIIIEESIYIHKKLGPGLLESVYEAALYHRLIQRGLQVTRQQGVPVIFDEIKMDIGFRADLIVENSVIVELKSQEIIPPVYYKKLLTYLRLSNMPLGLLINFHEVLLKDGIRRIINGYQMV